MSIVAIIPVGNLASANASLESQGFGPGNFSIPCHQGAGVTHAALHCWGNPAFATAVKSIPGVVFDESEGEPHARTRALIEAQGAKWGDDSDEMPEGVVNSGEMYRYGDSLWYIIQTHDRSVYGGDPAQYPALCRRARNPYAVEPWRQPIDQYDSYKLVNPFTGTPDRCTHNGSTWEVTQADGAGNNIWEPGVFGWVQV